MPWPQSGATHCHAQILISDKGRAIKGLFVVYVVWQVPKTPRSYIQIHIT